MRLAETAIRGVFDVFSTPRADARGSFTRIFEPAVMAKVGVSFRSADINLSRNPSRGTLRGLHYQDPPYAEAKLVRAVAGLIFDVVVDLRRNSHTRGRWLARELSADNAQALLVPEGCAHGFLTLEPYSDVLYVMSRSHQPGRQKGYRYDDPAFGINWPFPPALLSGADLGWPSYRDRPFEDNPLAD